MEALAARDLSMLVCEVGTTADRLGSLLAAVHGGHVVFPDASAAPIPTEE